MDWEQQLYPNWKKLSTGPFMKSDHQLAMEIDIHDLEKPNDGAINARLEQQK